MNHSVCSTNNKSYERRGYFQSKSKQLLRAKPDSDRMHTKNLDMRHKSISSPKMDALRVKYCKRSTEKSTRGLFPLSTSNHTQILSQKSDHSRSKQTEENQMDDVIVYDLEGTSQLKHHYNPRIKRDPATIRKPSDVSTGTGASRSLNSTPFTSISNNIKGEWVYDKSKGDLSRK